MPSSPKRKKERPPRREFGADIDVHRATFSQPTGKLNPLGARMSAPVLIEVFQSNPTTWRAREATRRHVIEAAAQHRQPMGMRFLVASLFEDQISPWSIDGNPDPTANPAYWHLHQAADAPSVCGSRYHVNRDGWPPSIDLPSFRHGNLPHAAGSGAIKACPICAALIDRSSQPGDLVRWPKEGKTGYVVAAPRPDTRVIAAGANELGELGEQFTVKTSELVTVFLEQIR